MSVFTAGEKFIVGQSAYLTKEDAENRSNQKTLDKAYQGIEETAAPPSIYSDGKVYLLSAEGAETSWLSSEEVTHIRQGNMPEARAAAKQLSEHFMKTEFQCECKGKYCNGYNGISESELIKTAEFLEKFRRYVGGKAIIVRSGVRCPKVNKAAGGAASSQHLSGKAADISVMGMSQADIAKKAIEFCKGLKYGGVGYGGNHYTHIDRRGEKEKRGVETWKY